MPQISSFYSCLRHKPIPATPCSSLIFLFTFSFRFLFFLFFFGISMSSSCKGTHYWSNQLLNLFHSWPLVGSWRRRSLPLRPTSNYWIASILMGQHEVSEQWLSSSFIFSTSFVDFPSSFCEEVYGSYILDFFSQQVPRN